MTLPPPPDVPPGVQYALTLKRTVLQSDLRLRGNSRANFGQVLSIDYALPYLAIDDGVVSWNYAADVAFHEALFGTRPLRVGVARFIAAMSALARAMDRGSAVLASRTGRLGPADVLADLRDYWLLYEQYATCLFVFWNVEHALVDALTTTAGAANLTEDIEDDFARYFQASEANYFVLERRNIHRLAERFVAPGKLTPDLGSLSPAFREALEYHLHYFGFMLAPFSVDHTASLTAVLARVERRGASARRACSPSWHHCNTDRRLSTGPPGVGARGATAHLLAPRATRRPGSRGFSCDASLRASGRVSRAVARSPLRDEPTRNRGIVTHRAPISGPLASRGAA